MQCSRYDGLVTTWLAECPGGRERGIVVRQEGQGHEELDSGADSGVTDDNFYRKGKSRRGCLTRRILARGVVWVVMVLTKE